MESQSRRSKLYRCVEQAAGALMEGLEDRRLLSAVSLPIDLDAHRGDTLHVPIIIDDATGLMAADLTINYDTTALDLSDADVVRGEVIPAAWPLFALANDAAGTVSFSMYTPGQPLSGGSGKIVDLVFHVPQNAPTGMTALTVTGSLDEVPITPIIGNVTVIDQSAVNVALPKDVQARPGETVSVPVTIDNAAGLQGMNLTITYDTSLLDLTTDDVLKGSLLPSNWQVVANVIDASGIINVAAYVIGAPLDGGSGELINLLFHVPTNAPAGNTSLAISGELNEGAVAMNAISGSLKVVADSKLTINGDQGGAAQDDVIRLQLSETDSTKLNVFFGASTTPSATYSLTGVSSVVVNGLAGNDRLVIDASNGMPAVAGGISFNGGAGQDVLSVENTGSTSISASDTQLSFGATPVTYTAVEGIGWEPGTGAALTLSGNLAVALDVSADLASLTLNDSAKLTLAKGSNAVLKVGALTLGANAVLDLNDNDLIVSATAETRQAVLAAVSAAIKSARGSDSKWLGAGLTSSEAKSNKQAGLAVMLNNRNGAAIVSQFAGQSVGSNDILVKYTWNGDANLDGIVDAADYFLVDSGYITQQGGYRNGDLNFDNVVDAADYFLIDSAYIAQSGTLAAETTPTAAEDDDVVLKATTAVKTPQAPSVLEQLFSTQPLM